MGTCCILIDPWDIATRNSLASYSPMEKTSFGIVFCNFRFEKAAATLLHLMSGSQMLFGRT